ncbi:DUF2155 domain-containing protein [Candidatus Pelagibacter sp.]|uniref:DUF2155 domain-containing protein n=1 Tax=Candidatus Pelagibacter sp. TaxID=2024849 RepID=UPI003F85DEC0
MNLGRNIKAGLINIVLLFFFTTMVHSEIKLDKNFTEIKILNKISSKNISLELKNNEEKVFDDLIIKSIKCKNSEFDDDPEIIAYIQVIDQSITNNDEVYVFNGWMFSSSPSINPFDHPVYDVWLTGCY